MPTLLDLISGTAENAAGAIVATLLAVYLFLYRWQFLKKHPNEPPIIPSAVPFVGHLLGMALQGGRYAKNLGLRNPDKPIFTLPVPRSRIYVVTDPSLAAAVQRASRTLSFTPLVPDITQRVLGLDDDTVAIVRQHIDPEPSEPRGFLADIHDMVYSYLGPGEALNELSLGAVRDLARQVDCYAEALRDSKGGKETVDLLTWIRHFVAISTARFLYGDENPFAVHPELEAAFWDFDHGLGGLLMGLFPSITARKAYRGREALAAAFEEHLTKGRHKNASAIIQKRVSIALQHGWTLRAAARSEVSFLFAGIVNTATTTFWMVLHLFASPDLLSTVRTDLSSSLATDDSDPNTLILDLNALKTCSPTLASVLRETLRYTSDNYSTRLVKFPTTLPGGYYLSQGSVVQIAGGTMHADTRIWGADATAFNPLRFLPASSSSSSPPPSSADKIPSNDTDAPSTKATTHPAAFRAFGGGKTLCPGRHFATAEILALVAMLVTRFDIVGLEDIEGEDDDDNYNDDNKTRSKGPKKGIEMPGKEDGVMPVHVLEPKKAVTVRVKVRGEVRGMKVVG
ncbi:Cholesterol 7-alpha-monooxygenase [Madurella mycetomatis]|uniref:Cholesterol 7-alpha-monooxygenase n=1 Tax=Madurella mycetomatis TaxID=100816 RepID=A0A175VXA9_9PEZI|nr:Cholesterol 7-alpha-monooxygenase [Madurella mycetomatis]